MACLVLAGLSLQAPFVSQGRAASSTLPAYADATARDAAITSPQEGDLIRLISTNMLQCYLNGAWETITSL